MMETKPRCSIRSAVSLACFCLTVYNKETNNECSLCLLCSNNDLQLNIVGLRLQLGQTARTSTLVGRGPTSASAGGRVSRVYKSCSIVAPPLSPAFVILQGDHYTFSGLMSPRTACRYSHTCCRFLMHRWLNLWQRKVGVKVRSSQASLSKRFPIVFRRYTCNRSKGTKVYCHSHLRTITG